MQAKKPDFKIFAGGAEDGELHDFPDVTRGWGVTKLQTNKKPPLSWMNGAFNRVDNNFYYLLQNGLAEWNSEIGYSVGALSQVDGVIYRAKEAVKGESPSSSAKWERLFADKGGTSDFIGMSQRAIKKKLDKKFDSWSLTQTVTRGKGKAPSNFAVSEALKEQDPRQWGFGAQSMKFNLDIDTIEKQEDYLVANSYSHVFRADGKWKWQHMTNAVFLCGSAMTGFVVSQRDVMFTYADIKKRVFSYITPYTDKNTTIDPNGVLTTKQATVTLTTKDLAKETGNSHSKVMTQKAATDAINNAVIKNTASKSDHGWWKCASTGIIIQWGRGTNVRTFPIAFPTKVCSITAAVNKSDGDNEIGARVTNVSNTSFKVSSGKGKTDYPYYWQAIGF